ncbi:MAG: nitroreductase [Planctomicrobium sp.]|jgi:nitroreductase|nr:nitroreductase [Planctomicrobium sp.]
MATSTEIQEPVAKNIRDRRTINSFRSEVPPQETILHAIELACWAPNHKLTEPWRYYLLGSETFQRIVELNTKLVTASKGVEAAEKKREKWSQIPGWLVVTYQRSEDKLRDQENYAAVCCAIQNFSLSLWSAGIGMKWTTGPVTRDDGIYQILDLNREQEEIAGVLWYGYPAEVPSMKRHPPDQFITQLP